LTYRRKYAKIKRVDWGEHMQKFKVEINSKHKLLDLKLKETFRYKDLKGILFQDTNKRF